MKDFISRFIVVLFFVPLISILAGFMVFVTLLIDGIAYVAWDSKHVWLSYYVVEFLFPQDEQEETAPSGEPGETLTENILYEYGFREMKHIFMDRTCYMRGDNHPDGPACVTLYCGDYQGPMMYYGANVTYCNIPLKTRQDLVDYLNNPSRDK